MTTIIICIIVYLFSAYKIWYWLRLDYNNGHIEKIGYEHFIFVVTPVYNTVLCIVIIVTSVYKTLCSSNKFLNWFFKIK